MRRQQSCQHPAPYYGAALLASLLLIAALVSGCATTPVAAQSEPTAAPTASPRPIPTPTPLPTPEHEQIAADVQVAGVDLSGLEASTAAARLEQALTALYSPLTLRAGPLLSSLSPSEISYTVHYAAMADEALRAEAGARLPLRASYDEAGLIARLRAMAQQVDRPAMFRVLTSTVAMSRSFALQPGVRLDIDAAAIVIGTHLRSREGIGTLDLAMHSVAGQPMPAELQAELERVATNWKGVVGVYVYDLERQATVAQLNPNTVFSGASVMKVPIMLNAYLSLPSFSAKQERWLQSMIEQSDNNAANALLAASVGGAGITDALKGTEKMTEMLLALGLEHTYQYAPYQSSEWAKVKKVRVRSGPAREGSPPYTAADPRLRTTPAEMSRVFSLIEQCSEGQGQLLAAYAQQLTPTRCQEMIDRLRRNADTTRMVAGLPRGSDVAHKSGWIDDMQADVGVVRTPGGNYIAAIYLYLPGRYGNAAKATPAIGHLSRLIYSYYNPVQR